MNDRIVKMIEQTKAGMSILLIPAFMILVFQYIYFNSTGEAIAEFEAKPNETVGKSLPDLVEVIKLDIRGEIVSPGVYDLPIDSRLGDLVESAGGFTEQVDREYVDKELNMAKKLIDSEKVYIPSIDDYVALNASISSDVNGLISINNASQSDLESLPGIGPATAQKIISNRPYSSIEGLLSVPGIGDSKYSQIKDLVQL